jgi:hypothetical protein
MSGIETVASRIGSFSAALSIWVAAGAPLLLADEAKAPAVDFERDIAPLIAGRCLGCHSDVEKSGGLVLSSRAALTRGGDGGAVIVEGKPEASRLIERLAKGEMPPPAKGVSRALPDAEQARLRAWVAAGAPWPEGRTISAYEVTTDSRAGRDWWALHPIVRPAIPEPRSGAAAEGPIDRFILDRLEREGLEPAPLAARRTLLRRARFDLLGLPPSDDELARFEAAAAPDAYERELDRLLAAPQLGERWGRHWLDLVRYADSNGYERDAPKPNAWKYRDYVIRAVNEDKPFDRFASEQLAGDELPDRSEETAIATGFLRLGTWDDEPNDALEYRFERLDDMVHATTTAFLAYTVRCARCHDHKFDPVTQVDYHRLAAAFWPGPIGPRGRELQGGPSAAELGYDVLGWTDLGREAPPFHRLHRGDPRQPREAIEPGFLSMLPQLDRAVPPPRAGARGTERRLALARWIVDGSNPLAARVAVNRLWMHHFGAALVRSPGNFGFKGERPTHPELLDWLARELIDGGWSQKRLHLRLLSSAAYRRASVHPREEDYQQRDFENRLWWRAQRRRLEAEALRDALLAAAGELNLEMGGPGFFPRLAADALEGLSRKGEAWGDSPPDQRARRSIYIFSKRSLLLPLFATFDLCDTTQGCPQRDVSTVAPQALALLNNFFVHDSSAALARRALREAGAGADVMRTVESAFRCALGRGPGADEAAAARDHIAAQREHFAAQASAGRGAAEASDPAFLALTSLCHALLNLNEFIYVD